MELSRRDILKLLAIGAGAGLAPLDVESAERAPERLLDFEALGNVTLLHVTEPHAMLLPVYYREPDTLIGVGPERGCGRMRSHPAAPRRMRARISIL